ncbi:head-tail connector protein [Pseudomonas lundensis]|uniref:head-tail connector protein n=1 Tax=Pseudomonas lundensis TaxID=86185 RepID=UPI00390831CF
MTVIDINVAMQHLRAEPEDQAHVEMLLAAAEDDAMKFLNRRFYRDEPALEAAIIDGSAGTAPMLISPSVRAACLLSVGHLFEEREDGEAIPQASRALLTPDRVGWGI